MTAPALHELLQHAAALRRLAVDLVGGSDADDVLQDAAIAALQGPTPRAAGVGWWFRVVKKPRRQAAAGRRGAPAP